MQPEGGAKGHLVKFSFNSIGVVDEVSYLVSLGIANYSGQLRFSVVVVVELCRAARDLFK